MSRILGSFQFVHGPNSLQVSTGNLNKAVSRNLDRFPEDFVLQLTEEEFANLIFHFGTLHCRFALAIGFEKEQPFRPRKIQYRPISEGKNLAGLLGISNT